MAQKEIYSGPGKTLITEKDETWLERLEQQWCSVEVPLPLVATPNKLVRSVVGSLFLSGN